MLTASQPVELGVDRLNPQTASLTFLFYKKAQIFIVKKT